MSTVSKEYLACPICLVIPPAEIFQCANGHHLCKGCKSKVWNCPSCRIPFGTIVARNLAMESLLDSLSFDCPIGSNCQKKIPRKDLSEHEEICKFRKINLCKRIGFPACERTFVANNRGLTLAHLKEHGIKVCNEKSLLLSFEKLQECVQNPNNLQNSQMKWEPVLWKHPSRHPKQKRKNPYSTNKPASPTFLIFCWTSQQPLSEVMFNFCCLQITSSEVEAAKYSFEYSIKTVFSPKEESDVSLVEHTHVCSNSPPVPFTMFERVLKDPQNPIPLRFFTDYIKGMRFEVPLRNDDLLIRVKMKKPEASSIPDPKPVTLHLIA